MSTDPLTWKEARYLRQLTIGAAHSMLASAAITGDKNQIDQAEWVATLGAKLREMEQERKWEEAIEDESGR